MIEKQFVTCQICGVRFLTDFLDYDGRACKRSCYDELQWRMVLCLTGEDYRQQPRCEDHEDG